MSEGTGSKDRGQTSSATKASSEGGSKDKGQTSNATKASSEGESITTRISRTRSNPYKMTTLKNLIGSTSVMAATSNFSKKMASLSRPSES